MLPPPSAAPEEGSAVCSFTSGDVSFRVGISEDRNRRCRRVMEDTHSVEMNYCGVPGQGFFGVFDGHGGRTAAEWCGEHFHKTLKGCLEDNQGKEPVPEVLKQAFLAADARLAENKQDHSGCTVITALLTRKLYTANVGDARAVLCRGGKAIRMSYDHKGTDQRESQRITDKGGFMMGNRVNGMLAVTRALGDTAMKEFVIGLPYTQEVDLCEDDTFLILACDGLWDVCDDQTAIDLIKNIANPHEASQKLMKYALDNFSSDNLTIMVIRFS
ncbi:phosphatase 2C-like domain-containing protein [Syncephalis pseudoplumigaleata]|uniref:Phosphatase 2C-like domain-containing protein n=1 Tax=Syncephalis pseudoplumigaleata TaxID=1712513 RepID=A0A4P9YZS1_9FUNG|nr:phosphatase 2C-like domain-containing protein [Syncephalis pseudoplumigaleata]|eukprot:RKP24921.1 phosphatase 2C-like domain-containing protein [Syncephalis pseudoplumigaleata]